jgi:hypothetical protein
MIKEFKQVRQWFSRVTNREFDSDLAPQVKEILAKIEENDLQDVEFFTWKLLNDYLIWHGMGIKYKAMRKKVVEAILKFGEDSLFWEERERSRTQRKTDWIRVSYLCKCLSELDWKAWKLKDKGKLSRFMKLALDYRRKLKINPLSEKQLIQVYECERMLGIYYEDMSPEFNGEKWRLEALKALEEENE